ncbi:hypothetical protein ACVBEF_12235 [Glaciimonas sp. GG7]
MNAPLMVANSANSAMIERELNWLQRIIEQRFAARQEARHPGLDALTAPPDVSAGNGPFAAFLRDMTLIPQERLILILAMAPHIAPEALDAFLLHNKAIERRFSEFGGITGQSHGGFLPTVETALFLLAGANLHERLQARNLFAVHHKLIAARVLEIDHERPVEPFSSSALRLSREYLEILLTGEDQFIPSLSEFPAERISTPLQWESIRACPWYSA